MQLNSRPIVVSLYSSHDYYREAAERLRADCNRLNIESDIVELAGSGDKDWISICRAKVPFFLEMFDKHERPILWLDADSRLRDWPVVFDGLRCDLAGFLRGLRYLRDFDPVALPRFFAPFALFFGASPAARAFLETMVELERGFTDAATDDYFLEQAWREHERQLAIAVLPPSLVDKDWPPAAGAPIHVGVSGNVTTHKSNAQQHVAPLHEAARRRAMLLSEAGLARKAGQPNDALVLYRRAAAIGPRDEVLEKKIERLARHGSHTAADANVNREQRGDREDRAHCEDGIDREHLADGETLAHRDDVTGAQRSVWRRWVTHR